MRAHPHLVLIDRPITATARPTRTAGGQTTLQRVHKWTPYCVEGTSPPFSYSERSRVRGERDRRQAVLFTVTSIFPW